MYEYGLIGNCQVAALINQKASVEWLCFPRPDSPPVFGKLLDPDGGDFSLELENQVSCHQKYIQNTNVLETTLVDEKGASVRVLDFCPRFEQFGRMFRPHSFFRIVEPQHGTPLLKVRCQPICGWEKEQPRAVRGSSHLRYDIRGESMRLYTSMSLTYLLEGISVPVQEKIYFALTWGSNLEEALEDVSERFLTKTLEYWQHWVQHCSIPSQHQSQTIRSALVLKLHCYEDTGAILASLTTSLPEEIGGERNWDYRLCWLRDSYYVLTAFHELGHFEEMEGFLRYLTRLALMEKEERLKPVYMLDQRLPLPERSLEHWQGFQNSKPVRFHNQAAEHVQNDVYGEMILTLAPIFFDERFSHLRSKETQGLLESLALQADRSISIPDAGLWELRDGWQEHTFTNLMAWAGLERIRRIHQLGYLKNLKLNPEESMQRAEKALRAAVVEGSLRNGPKDSSFDSSILQLPLLRYPDQNLCRQTVHDIAKSLIYQSKGKSYPGFLYRYSRQDDFGKPTSSFLICSFWLVQALAEVGDLEEARKVMDILQKAANSLGLFAEHYCPDRHLQTGNFPQAYSHVGQILAAFAVSPLWKDVL
ncbi:MAG: glycoside hydrolase family 15 protein [Pseudobdellovibrionaceae bacterium]